jgi:hypothetical protein
LGANMAETREISNPGLKQWAGLCGAVASASQMAL